MAYSWLGALLIVAATVIGCANGEDGGARGDAGTDGVGGTGGSLPQCATSFLCRACPAEAPCETSNDCAVGSVCVESGCDDLDGTPIRQCVFAGGGACNTSAQCTNGRECIEVPGEGKRCVKTTAGCDTSFDCALGFTCEDGSCVDRRVPCDLDQDCPKNHICDGTTNSRLLLEI